MTYSPVLGSRESVLRRGQVIEGWLGQLYILYIVFIVLYLLGFLFFLISMGQLRDIPMAAGMSVGVVGLSMVPGLVVSLLYLWAIRAAQGAIRGVRSYAGEGRIPAGLEADLQRMNVWLTAGQVLGVLSGIFSVIMAFTTSSFIPQEAGVGQSNAFLVLPNVIVGIAAAALNWLIFGAIKSFFTAVLARLQGQTGAVMPAANRAATWLQFVYILQWIGVVIGGLGALIGIFAFIALADNTVSNGFSLMFLVFMLPVIAFYAWLLSLFVRLIGHSRLFALDAAAQLDQPQNMAAGTALIPDPWANP